MHPTLAGALIRTPRLATVVLGKFDSWPRHVRIVRHSTHLRVHGRLEHSPGTSGGSLCPACCPRETGRRLGWLGGPLRGLAFGYEEVAALWVGFEGGLSACSLDLAGHVDVRVG